jgi:sec-independent protein translocase protein TatB
MFDFGVGYSELFVLAVIAVIVIGPKDLPKVLRAFGKTVTKMRGMAREFQGHLDSAMKDAGLDDVKKEVQGIKSAVSSVANPLGAIAKSVTNDLKTDVKKADDDFTKYFGDPIAKPAAELPKPAPEPAKAPEKAS